MNMNQLGSEMINLNDIIDKIIDIPPAVFVAAVFCIVISAAGVCSI